MPMKGLDDAIKRNLDMQQRANLQAQKAMQEILFVIGAEASTLTPIDTSTLINSQYTRVNQAADGVVGKIGYSANYAPFVHDPKVKQNFRRPGAEKEFLKKGIERTKGEQEKIIDKNMRELFK